MVATHVRSIERVPVLLIGLLDAAGNLPLLPPHIDGLGRASRARAATLDEAASLTWLAAWDRPRIDAKGAKIQKPVGIAAYRDVFDYHTGTDVREVVHIAGTRRAVYELMRTMRDQARIVGLRLIGSIAVENTAMAAVLKGLGGEMTRVVFEDMR